jgi:hypothetical protein
MQLIMQEPTPPFRAVHRPIQLIMQEPTPPHRAVHRPIPLIMQQPTSPHRAVHRPIELIMQETTPPLRFTGSLHLAMPRPASPRHLQSCLTSSYRGLFHLIMHRPTSPRHAQAKPPCHGRDGLSPLCLHQTRSTSSQTQSTSKCVVPLHNVVHKATQNRHEQTRSTSSCTGPLDCTMYGQTVLRREQVHSTSDKTLFVFNMIMICRFYSYDTFTNTVQHSCTCTGMDLIGINRCTWYIFELLHPYPTKQILNRSSTSACSC